MKPSLEDFARAVARHDMTFYKHHDADMRLRGARELHEIEHLKSDLGKENAQVCRDIWNAKVDRTFKTAQDRQQYYWREQPVILQGDVGVERYQARRALVEDVIDRKERTGKFWQGAYETAGRVWEYVMGALWDCYRRGVDEAWFGKTTYDWMTERHYKTNQAEKFSPIYSGPDWEAKREAAREDVLQHFYGEAQKSFAFENDPENFRGQGMGI